MSPVFMAMDTVLERLVAVKLLAEHLADDDAFVARFRLEAVAAARLQHPNIVQVFDSGLDPASDRHYIVMEYVEGPSCADLLRDQGQLDIEESVRIVRDACHGLDYAHRHGAGVIHRDLSPRNVMVSRAGEVKVVDFGVAKALTTALAASGTNPANPSTSLAIVLSLASLPLAASCLSAASCSTAPACFSGGAALIAAIPALDTVEVAAGDEKTGLTILRRALGELDAAVTGRMLSVNEWTQHLLCADRYREGRAFVTDDVQCPPVADDAGLRSMRRAASVSFVGRRLPHESQFMTLQSACVTPCRLDSTCIDPYLYRPWTISASPSSTAMKGSGWEPWAAQLPPAFHTPYPSHHGIKATVWNDIKTHLRCYDSASTCYRGLR